MVSSGHVKVLVPNIKNHVPGGGSWLWRVCNRGVLGSVGLLSKGFLKLQRSVKVEGMEKFLEILEGERDRGIITGSFPWKGVLMGSFESFICVGVVLDVVDG